MSDENNRREEFYPAALTVAGSDSGGGAGIEADLRTFNAYGVYGCAAITAVTAQNPREVRRIDPLPPEAVRAQIEAVLDVFPVRFVKTGMMANAGIVHAVAETFRRRQLHLIVDPVMVATSGARLLEESAVQAVIDELIPLADWITPNLPEAELLLGHAIRTPAEVQSAARECAQKWHVGVCLKTGHAPGPKRVTDYLCRSGECLALSSPRAPERGASHGTGCTLSSAIAAGLAMGLSWKEAMCDAKAFVYGSLCETVVLADHLQAMYPPAEDNYPDEVRLEKIRD